MDKKFCGPMRPVGYLALFVAIFVANMPGAEAKELFDVSRSASGQIGNVIPGPGASAGPIDAVDTKHWRSS